jgi:voltage-gated potassium channel
MPSEPIYVMSLEEIVWGLALIAVTIIMHGFGTTCAILATEKSADPTQPERLGLGLARIIELSLLLIVLHLLEVIVWAGFFSWQGCFRTMSLSYYFALLEYTTLGSDYNLPSRWRLLEGMIAICGLLTFAWTTSVLMGVIQQIQDRRVRR